MKSVKKKLKKLYTRRLRSCCQKIESHEFYNIYLDDLYDTNKMVKSLFHVFNKLEIYVEI